MAENFRKLKTVLFTKFITYDSIQKSYSFTNVHGHFVIKLKNPLAIKNILMSFIFGILNDN